jgi:hypothetical protein
MNTLTAVRDRDKGSVFSDCFLLTGGDEGACSIKADHERGHQGDCGSRSFSSPPEALMDSR